MKVDKDKISRDLPNFPEEVKELWIYDCASRLGWPPETKAWVRVLLGRDLAFWSGVSWKKIELDLSRVALGNSSERLVVNVKKACMVGEDNHYFKAFGSGGMKRFLRIWGHLLRFGTFPKPVVLLRVGDVYEIADGYHRFAAYLSIKEVEQYINKKKLTKEQENIINKYKILIKQKYDFEGSVQVADIQTAWIAQ